MINQLIVGQFPNCFMHFIPFPSVMSVCLLSSDNCVLIFEMPDLENASADFRISEKKKLFLFMAAFIYPDLVPDQIISDRDPCTCVGLTLGTVYRIMGVSYPGCFVPKTIRIQVGRFVPSGSDVSYPKFGRFVPKGLTFRTQRLGVSYPMHF